MGCRERERVSEIGYPDVPSGYDSRVEGQGVVLKHVPVRQTAVTLLSMSSHHEGTPFIAAARKLQIRLGQCLFNSLAVRVRSSNIVRT